MKFTYTFDQLRDVPAENTYRLFENYERTMERFGAVDLDRYYTADYGVIEAETPEAACEALFKKYNVEHPEDYTGRSMAVSDIVNLWDNSTDPPIKSTWFCDSIGFKRLEESK